jgi:hypothetical protein
LFDVGASKKPGYYEAAAFVPFADSNQIFYKLFTFFSGFVNFFLVYSDELLN